MSRAPSGANATPVGPHCPLLCMPPTTTRCVNSSASVAYICHPQAGRPSIALAPRSPGGRPSAEAWPPGTVGQERGDKSAACGARMAEAVEWLGGLDVALAAARDRRRIALVDFARPG